MMSQSVLNGHLQNHRAQSQHIAPPAQSNVDTKRVAVLQQTNMKRHCFDNLKEKLCNINAQCLTWTRKLCPINQTPFQS